MATVHIIGGGIAGLAAAVELSRQADVRLYEAYTQCGGRVRAFYDPRLDRVIDNGHHMFLSANDCIFHYLSTIGSEDLVAGPEKPVFPFFDIQSMKAWVLRIPENALPWNLFKAKIMPPKMKPSELKSFYKILKAKPETTVEECLQEGSLKHFLLKDLAISALNAPLAKGSAWLLSNVLKKTLFRGGSACVPYYAQNSLSETFVDPAIDYITRSGGVVSCGVRARSLKVERGFVTGIETSKGLVKLEEGDQVILAASPKGTADLLKTTGYTFEEELGVDTFESILNVHFKVDSSFKIPHLIQKTGFVGLAGSIVEWVFVRDDVLSVTVSAANKYEEWERSELLKTIWSDVCYAMGFKSSEHFPPMPVHRVIWEKKATFEAVPEQQKRRLGTLTPWPNVVLAGDSINNGLPSTIEGAIQTGLAAVGSLGYRSKISDPFCASD